MAEESNKDQPRFDPAIQSEDIAFKPDEMVACPKCSRKNPPNRFNCLYCATDLGVASPQGGRSIFRKLEAWEKGWNVVVTRSGEDADLSSAASYLAIEGEHLSKIAETGTALPVERVESQREAMAVVDELNGHGLACIIVADDELLSSRPPVRLSAVEIVGEEIAVTDFNRQETSRFGARDLALIVTGVVAQSRVDSLEKRRHGKEAKVLEEVATTSDESVIDLYTSADPTGYRIQTAGFDFSTLGADKGLLASENIRSLAVRLKEFAPGAKFVSDYSSVRHLLDPVWEIESRKDPQGLRRAGFARKEFATVSSTSNLTQFTKYSRLQWHLL